MSPVPCPLPITGISVGFPSFPSLPRLFSCPKVNSYSLGRKQYRLESLLLLLFFPLQPISAFSPCSAPASAPHPPLHPRLRPNLSDHRSLPQAPRRPAKHNPSPPPNPELHICDQPTPCHCPSIRLIQHPSHLPNQASPTPWTRHCRRPGPAESRGSNPATNPRPYPALTANASLPAWYVLLTMHCIAHNLPQFRVASATRQVNRTLN